MRYDILLWDVDHTLLDFKAAERFAIRDTFRHFQTDISDADIADYSVINAAGWRRYEAGEVTKAEVLTGRFREFFPMIGAKLDPEAFDLYYQSALGDYAFWMDGAEQLIPRLKPFCRQYLVTNGTALAQRKKLKLSGLDRLADGIFISEEMGSNKPEKRFYELCAAAIESFDPARTLAIGDSLTSDIQGANNAGLPCCWYNPEHLPPRPDLRIDYVIDDLRQLPVLLGVEP